MRFYSRSLQKFRSTLEVGDREHDDFDRRQTIDDLIRKSREEQPARQAIRRDVRIGSAAEDQVTAFIPPHATGDFYGAMGEGVAVDADGHVYAAEGPASRPVAGAGLTKYVAQPN